MIVALATAPDVGAADTPYAVGNTITPFSIQDQHDRPARIGPEVRIMFLTRDMEAGRLVREALAERDQAFLDARSAVYVADVSRMPALITRTFALPGMRRRTYRMLLDHDGSLTRDVPYVKGKVTVVRLDGLRVTEVAHVASAAELTAALGNVDGGASSGPAAEGSPPASDRPPEGP